MMKVRVKFAILVIASFIYIVSLGTIYKCVLVLQGGVEEVDDSRKPGINTADITTADPFRLNWNPDAKAYFKKVKDNVSGTAEDDEADVVEEDCAVEPRHFRRVTDGLYVYSAYIDNRTGSPVLRMFAAMKKWLPPKLDRRLWCHFEAGVTTGVGESFVSSQASLYQMCENHNMEYGAWMINCQLPLQISSAPTYLRIGNADTARKSLNQSKYICVKSRDKYVETRPLQFGVCVPPLFGAVNAKQILEFIEFNRILGAERFVFYVEESARSVSMEIRKILQYYESLNVAILIPWKLPFENKSIWYHGQSIAINDCLYRNMHDFKHLVFVDLDEFLVPHGDINNWKELLTAMHRHYNYDFVKASGFSFKPAYFDPERSRKVFSNEMDTCIRTNRTRNYSRRRTKLMVRPERVFELGIHHVSKPWPENVNMSVVNVDPNLAYIHHYRECVFEFGIRCPMITVDETVPNKYGKPLLENYMKSKYDIHP